MKWKLFCGVLPILFYGCHSGADNINMSESKIKYGIISNACGPTDSAIVRITLTDKKISCSTDITSVPLISSYLEFPNTKNLTPGIKVKPHSYGSLGPDSATLCDIGLTNCNPIGLLTIEISDKKKGQLIGRYSIDKQKNVAQGRFIIEPCNNKRPVCG